MIDIKVVSVFNKLSKVIEVFYERSHTRSIRFNLFVSTSILLPNYECGPLVLENIGGQPVTVIHYLVY